jgi:hypothetical protein
MFGLRGVENETIDPARKRPWAKALIFAGLFRRTKALRLIPKTKTKQCFQQSLKPRLPLEKNKTTIFQ